MPNVVRHTTSGTAATVGVVGVVGVVGRADADTADPADCDGDVVDDGAAAGADTLELDADEHADVSTANASDATTATGQEGLRPMPELSARPPSRDGKKAEAIACNARRRQGDGVGKCALG